MKDNNPEFRMIH